MMGNEGCQNMGFSSHLILYRQRLCSGGGVKDGGGRYGLGGSTNGSKDGLL